MKDISVTALKVGFLETNCYILRSEKSGEAIVIDPGADALVIKSKLRELDAKCILVLLTHGHFDHILAADALRTSRAVVAIHEKDQKSLTERDSFSSIIPDDPRPLAPADIVFSKDGSYCAGDFKFSVIHTPGHTPGSVCYIFDDVMFTGDTLFKRSIGRTDFVGGSMEELNASLKKLYELPGDYLIYPGHDSRTLLSDERDYNPYMSCFKS